MPILPRRLVRALAAPLLAAVALGAGCNGPAVGRAAPDFRGVDNHGEPVSFAAMRGKVILLDFWATWCPPCVASSPAVQRIHETFEDDDRVVVLGVHYDDNGTPVEYMAEHGYTYRTLVNGWEAARAYGVRSIPTFVVISPDGEVVHSQVGFGRGDEQHLVDVIRRAL